MEEKKKSDYVVRNGLIQLMRNKVSYTGLGCATKGIPMIILGVAR